LTSPITNKEIDVIKIKKKNKTPKTSNKPGMLEHTWHPNTPEAEGGRKMVSSNLAWAT
jgi:hypothetical protein